MPSLPPSPSGPASPLCFAWEQDGKPRVLTLPLPLDPSSPAPRLELDMPPGCVSAEELRDGHMLLRITVPPPDDLRRDDSLRFTIGGDFPIREIHVRRTTCRIDASLLGTSAVPFHLPPHARAGLLWYGWGRFHELIALKQVPGGLSGSLVYVFRPRLRDPDFPDNGVLSRA